jgi:hypothetical protein
MKRRFIQLAGILTALWLLAGCATTGDPAQAAARDRVLNQYREALASMRAGKFADAKPPLDDALLTLGGISAGDRSARQARSLFREESRKTFRGEPYERVMAYHYRGILYWIDGEPDNARACFRSAQLQDADAEKNEFQADYALLDYLDGLVTTKLGGDGSDALKRSLGFARLGAPPAYDPAANVLVFAEFGQGPRKYATGNYGEQLRFNAGTSRSTAAVIKVAGQTIRAPAYDDLTYQATTRGGRVMDHVLANKAVFKGTTDSIGDAALISGAILAGQRGQNSAADEAGLGLLAAALVLKAFSAATTPAADTRMWDSLPNLIGFAAFQLPPGHHDATLEFLDTAGSVASTRTFSFDVVPGRDTVLFVSDHN